MSHFCDPFSSALKNSRIFNIFAFHVNLILIIKTSSDKKMLMDFLFMVLSYQFHIFFLHKYCRWNLRSRKERVMTLHEGLKSKNKPDLSCIKDMTIESLEKLFLFSTVFYLLFSMRLGKLKKKFLLGKRGSFSISMVQQTIWNSLE